MAKINGKIIRLSHQMLQLLILDDWAKLQKLNMIVHIYSK